MTLSNLVSSTGMFSILELDKSQTFAQQLDLSWEDNSGQEILSALSRTLLENLQPKSSGLILDPQYTLPLISGLKSKKELGILTALEKNHSADVDPLSNPMLDEEWGVEACANNYAGAKLELFYHPQEEQAMSKKQIVTELADYCRRLEVPFYLKLMVYTPGSEQFELERFQAMQLQAVQELRSHCDLIGLQYPHDSLACATLTAELDVPWIMVSDGYQYDDFKEALRDALEGGAQGFSAGQVLWQEMYELKDRKKELQLDKVESFIKTTAQDRVIELGRIVEEFASEG